MERRLAPRICGASLVLAARLDLGFLPASKLALAGDWEREIGYFTVAVSPVGGLGFVRTAPESS